MTKQFQFPSHEALGAFTGFLLRKVSTASFEGFAEIVGAYGLHPMHFGLLNIIDAEEPISQHDLGNRIGIDPSSMVARMEVLDEQGLIVRERRAEDRRNYDIRLSPKGRKVLTELRKKAKAHGERFFAPLSKSERAQFHRALAKLEASLEPAPED